MTKDTLPSISILIPIYNVEKYIAECLQSVMRQTYTGPMECIVVDDCGTDNSIAITEQLIAEYYAVKSQESRVESRIEFRILHHEHNRGLAVARNTAVDAAQGEFVMHLDSDDWLEDTAVANLVEKQLDANADIVSGNAIAHYHDREEIFAEPDYRDKHEMLSQTIQLSLDHVIWRRLIRRTLYLDNNIQAVEGVNIGEDHYTLPRLVYYAKSFAKCNEIVYHYNCLNVNSYMQSSSQSFNYAKYVSDVASINILIDFFTQNDSSYLDMLYAIKAHYVYGRFFVALKLGNEMAYKQICADWIIVDEKYRISERQTIRGMWLLSPKYYAFNRVRVFVRIVIKKTLGIRNYDL